MFTAGRVLGHMFYRYVSHLTKLAAYNLNATGPLPHRYTYVNAPLLIRQGFVTEYKYPSTGTQY